MDDAERCVVATATSLGSVRVATIATATTSGEPSDRRVEVLSHGVVRAHQSGQPREFRGGQFVLVKQSGQPIDLVNTPQNVPYTCKKSLQPSITTLAWILQRQPSPIQRVVHNIWSITSPFVNLYNPEESPNGL